MEDCSHSNWAAGLYGGWQLGTVVSHRSQEVAPPAQSQGAMPQGTAELFPEKFLGKVHAIPMSNRNPALYYALCIVCTNCLVTRAASYSHFNPKPQVSHSLGRCIVCLLMAMRS